MYHTIPCACTCAYVCAYNHNCAHAHLRICTVPANASTYEVNYLQLHHCNAAPACVCALNKCVHNSVVPTDGAHTKVEFLNACIKRFGEKDVMNEIKK